MKECKRCLTMESADTITFDSEGICGVCRNVEAKTNGKVNWETRRQELAAIVAKAKALNNQYDCIIPGSFAKDSTFQMLFCVRELGLRPLIVRYNHWHYRPQNEENMVNTLKQLGCDSIDVRVNWKVVKEMSREGIIRRGDQCIHCHQGVSTVPIQMALKYRVPLVIFGESLAEYQQFGYTLDGYELWDEERYNRAMSLGIRPDDMWEFIKDKGFDRRDLIPFEFPPRNEIEALGLKAICLGNYIPWDTKKQVERIKNELGWKGSVVEGSFEDYDKTECFAEGQREFSKFVKRGFGRSHHLANIAIRHGHMTREAGDALQKEHDGKRPQSLTRFLEHIEMSEDEFMETLRTHTVDPWTDEGRNYETGPALPDIDGWK